MADPILIGQVLRRMGYRAPRDPWADYVPPEDRAEGDPVCRDPDCDRDADGLDGFCAACSRERERDGRWETIPLEEQEGS